MEALVWVDERLFSAGLVGEITEWDLKQLRGKKSIYLTGNAIWCLDINKAKTQIAAGTDEGFVNIISVENKSFEYQKILDRQEGKILCCKFDHSGEYLVTGYCLFNLFV